MPPDAIVQRIQDPLVLTVGRINLDLYAEQAGLTMAEATTFVASVGGSPTNIAIVAQRLGVPSALLSAEGGDHAGQLVRAQVERYGVDTRWLHTVTAGATSLALLATPAPDAGERQFYRHRPADTFLPPDVVDNLPWDSVRVVVLSGDSLAQGTTPQAVQAVARGADQRGIDVWWDLDLRPSSWSEDPARYGQLLRPALSGAAVVIGTEEEFTALLHLRNTHDLTQEVRALDLPVVVLKLGARGALLLRRGQPDVEVSARSVSPVSTVGGGDSVAGALVAGRLLGLSWEEALDLAMKAAAWTVERPYCSTGFPTAAQLGLDGTPPSGFGGLSGDLGAGQIPRRSDTM